MSDQSFLQFNPTFNKHQKQITAGLEKVRHQLSSGKELLSPGDEPTDFELALSLDLERARERANMQSLQIRSNWYQTSLNHLEKIRETLTQMSALSLKGSGSDLLQQDRQSVNEEFKELKQSISSIADGLAGASTPGATFNRVPLFLGQAPEVIMGTELKEIKSGYEAINLYTGHEQAGFPTVPLLTSAFQVSATPTVTGTADAGSATSITLDVNAPAIDDVYQNLAITITAGIGAGQSATISSYDAITRTATFTTTLGIPLDNTSEYSIASDQDNNGLTGDKQVTSLRVAGGIWGGDNYRFNRLSEDIQTFIPLTQEEATYRTANAIPNTDLDPKTYVEKTLRRQRDIFDDEYGSLLTQENSKRMKEQVDNAIKQISILMTRQQAKSDHLKKQYEFGAELTTVHDLGIEALEGLDTARAATLHQRLTIDSDKILRLAAQISRSVGKLNQLLQ